MTRKELNMTTWGETKVGRNLYRLLDALRDQQTSTAYIRAETLAKTLLRAAAHGTIDNVPDKVAFRDLCDNFAFVDKESTSVIVARKAQTAFVAGIASILLDHWDQLPNDIKTDPSMEPFSAAMVKLDEAFEADYGA